MRVKIFIVLVLVLAVVFGSGCARTQNYGPVKVTEKGGKAKSVEINTGNGKATINVEKKTVTEEELGVPVYPGAVAESSGQYEGGEKGQVESMTQTMLTSNDDFDKVFKFYKSNLKNVQNNFNHETDGKKMAMFTVKGADGSDISINIVDDKEKKVTNIHVMKMQKSQK